MNRIFLLIATSVIFSMYSQVFAQSQDLPKFDVAAEFTTLERDQFSSGRTEPGFGGRFTSTSIASSVSKRPVTFSQSDVLIAPNRVA